MNDLERGRLLREWKTIDTMFRIACRQRHGGGREQLCVDCSELRDYARFRLERCPFGAGKPTCANCKVHCYRPEQRERIKDLMRFAGPRMLLSHPFLALMHVLVDERRPAPERPHRRSARGALAETS